jgi:2-iminobutanoate/2-iminopropanoate deaminase
MSAATRRLHPDGKPRSYAASTTVGDIVWACGQVPTDAAGGTPEAIGDQVRLALDNLAAVLADAGASLDTLVKTTVFLADLDEFDAYDRAWVERLSPHGLPPRTTVQVARFRGAKRVEIDAVAAVQIDK